MVHLFQTMTTTIPVAVREPELQCLVTDCNGDIIFIVREVQSVLIVHV